MQKTSTASLPRGKTPPNKCPGLDNKQSDGYLKNVEYYFIIIAPSSAHARSVKTRKVLSMVKKKLNWVG